MTVEDIEQYNIKPSFLKERLKEIINSDKVLHIVSEADRAYQYTLSKNELNFPAGYKDCGGFTIDIPGYEQPMEMFMSKELVQDRPENKKIKYMLTLPLGNPLRQVYERSRHL